MQEDLVIYGISFFVKRGSVQETGTSVKETLSVFR